MSASDHLSCSGSSCCPDPTPCTLSKTCQCHWFVLTRLSIHYSKYQPVTVCLACMKSELHKNQCVKSLYQHIRNEKGYAGRCRFLDRLELTNWHDPRWRQWWGAVKCQRFWKWRAEERNALLSGGKEKEGGLFIIKILGLHKYWWLPWRTYLFSEGLVWCYCPLRTSKKDKGLVTSARSQCAVAVPGQNRGARTSTSHHHWTLRLSEGEAVSSHPLYNFALQDMPAGTPPIQTTASLWQF